MCICSILSFLCGPLTLTPTPHTRTHAPYRFGELEASVYSITEVTVSLFIINMYLLSRNDNTEASGEEE